MNQEHSVTILEIPTQSAPIYPVLIADKNGLTLIDACFPFQFKTLEKEMDKKGFSVGDIRQIILTHQDYDHIGCVKDIQAQCPQVQIIAHELEAPYIDGRLTPIKIQELENQKDSLPPDLFSLYQQQKKFYETRRFFIEHKVKHQDILPIAGGIEIIHTPGHTPGHICLYIQNNKMLVAGDALQVDNGVLIGPSPQYTQDMPKALNSLKQLLTKEINYIVAYHGGLFQENIQNSLEQILASG